MGRDAPYMFSDAAAARWSGYRDLTPSRRLDRETLASWGLSAGPHAAEALALSAERDPEMREEGLFQLGQRLEAADRPEAAANIYSYLANSESNGVGDGIRRRAQSRLDVFSGAGSFGMRSEFLLRRLARESMEPTGLIGLTAASAVFRMTRLAALSRLAASPSANLLTRGFGARAAAGLLGFGAEATAFPLATRAASVAFGRDLDGSAGTLGREFASSFLVLGSMKLVGWAAPFAVPLTRGERGLGAQSLVNQTGMFGGILLGHRLEEAAGLRQHVDGAVSLIDSLAMLVQMNVAGRLAQGMMGEGFRNWELGLELQARTLAATPLPGPLPRGERGFGFHPMGELAFASSTGRVGPRRGGELPKIPVLMMANSGTPDGKALDTLPPPSESGIRPAPRRPWREWGRGTIPRVIFSTDSQTPKRAFAYELVIEPLENFFELGTERSIARREGRDITLKLVETDRTGLLHDYFTHGLRKLKFEVREGEERGALTIYHQPGEINLFNVHTRPLPFESPSKASLPPGAGTILMDWVATQAALRRETFNLIRINEPRIFDLVVRRGLLRIEESKLQACYFEEVHGHSVEGEGAFSDLAFREANRGAHFLNIVGRPNPELLPDEWRTLEMAKELPGSPNSPGPHPFRLRLEPLRKVIQEGYDGAFAAREGRMLYLKTRYSGPADDRFFSARVHKVLVDLREGETRGTAAFYLTDGALAAVNINLNEPPNNMRPGAGSIFLRYWAAQAARENLEFHSLYIKNPHILKIYERGGIFDPATVRIELGHWDHIYGVFEPSEVTVRDFRDPRIAAHFEDVTFMTPIVHVYGSPDPAILEGAHD